MTAKERYRVALKLLSEKGIDYADLQKDFAKTVDMIENAKDIANNPQPIQPITPNLPLQGQINPLSAPITQNPPQSTPMEQNGLNAPIMP